MCGCAAVRLYLGALPAVASAIYPCFRKLCDSTLSTLGQR